MVNRGGDGPDAGWYSGLGPVVRDEYAPPADPAAPRPRRGGGRHGRPGAPDSPPAAEIPPRYSPAPYAPPQYGPGDYGPPEYDRPRYDPAGYGPPAPAASDGADPYGGQPGPYGAPDPHGPADPYGPPAGRPPAGYGASGAYGPADPFGPPAGHEPPDTYSQPGARGAGESGPYGVTSPYGPADPYRPASRAGDAPGSGAGSYGQGADAAGPGAADPFGTDPFGTDPFGTDPLGTGPLGTGPGGSAPAPGRNGRHGRAGDYGSSAGHGSGQFPVPDQTGPLTRSGPQDFGPGLDQAGLPSRSGPPDFGERPDRSGPLPRAGAADWPDQSGPQYQAGAQFHQGAPHQTGPRDRTDPRAWPAEPDPWAAQAGRTGPQRPVGPPGPAAPYDDDRLAGRGPDPFGSGPDPYGDPGALPGLPPAAGPAGRSGPFRWEPPEKPEAGHPDQESNALWRNGRPVGPGGFAVGGLAAGPEDGSPAGRLEADDELPDGRDSWDGGRRDSAGPGPDPEDQPDWSGDERHPGFFRGFGDDENVDPPKRRHGRWLAPVISLVVILGILGTVGGFLAHTYAARHANYTGAGTGTLSFTVRSGDTATTLAPRLVAAGVIKSTDPFIAAAKESANADALTPGSFRLHHHMNATAAWNLLVNPTSRIQTTVIIPPGLRAASILSLLATRTGKPLSQFQQAYADTAALGLPSYANGNPEGYLFPDTYDFPPGTTPAGMLRQMVTEFTTQINSIGLAAAAQHAQLSEGQVITAASLLEAEADPGDYPKVARVIDNRLNMKMPLQFDSTVLYALHITGFSLTTAQLHVKSPYNTFLHTGLPPGPIDSPGLQAIDAVLHPAQGNWTYFVTIDPDSGLTKFTSNYAQFQQWVTESNKNIAKEKK